MKAYQSIVIVLLLCACTERREKLLEALDAAPETEFSSTAEQPVETEFPEGAPAVPEFPGRPYQKAIAYELNGRYGDARAASVFHNRTGKQVELTETQIADQPGPAATLGRTLPLTCIILYKNLICI